MVKVWIMDRMGDGPIFFPLFWWQNKNTFNNDGNNGHVLNSITCEQTLVIRWYFAHRSGMQYYTKAKETDGESEGVKLETSCTVSVLKPWRPVHRLRLRLRFFMASNGLCRGCWYCGNRTRWTLPLNSVQPVKVCSHLLDFSPFLFNIALMETDHIMGRMGFHPISPFNGPFNTAR